MQSFEAYAVTLVCTFNAPIMKDFGRGMALEASICWRLASHSISVDGLETLQCYAERGMLCTITFLLNTIHVCTLHSSMNQATTRGKTQHLSIVLRAVC